MQKVDSIYKKIIDLPEEYEHELILFIEFLAEKARKNIQSSHPKAGFLKGTFTVADDFDAPLEDFKEYMQ